MSIVQEHLVDGVEPENLQPGEIFVRKTEHVVNATGHGYERRRVAVGDVSLLVDRKRLDAAVGEQDDILKQHPEWPIPTMRNMFPENPISREFYPVGSSMRYWRQHHVPYAEALYPIQMLDDAGRFFPDGEVDDDAMDIFRNERDSVAIRSRGAVHTETVLGHIAQSSQQEFKALALGAGAGVPNILATKQAMEQFGKRIHWDMYDTRRVSLERAKEVASRFGIPSEDISTHHKDYRKSFLLEPESLDMIDMLGLWEYLQREDCRVSIEELMKLLKPGGILMISNMRDDRLHLDFNQRGVLWPLVVPRSEDEVIDMAYEAGVDTNNITLTVTDDGVYSFMEIRK